jgi:aspartate racemase
LLATTFTAESGVHSRELQARRVSLVLPGTADQVVAEEIIVRIESGLRTERDRCRLVEIVVRMRERGATGVILGCTEIPLLLSADDLGCPSFDTLEILADSCFRYITGQEEA